MFLFTGLLLTMLMTLGHAGQAYGKSYYTDDCLTSAFWPGRTNHPEMCTFGWETDPCGNTFCAKGPREMCGGKNNRYGLCGEGLMCGNCDRYRKILNIFQLWTIMS